MVSSSGLGADCLYTCSTTLSRTTNYTPSATMVDGSASKLGGLKPTKPTARPRTHANKFLFENTFSLPPLSLSLSVHR